MPPPLIFPALCYLARFLHGPAASPAGENLRPADYDFRDCRICLAPTGIIRVPAGMTASVARSSQKHHSANIMVLTRKRIEKAELTKYQAAAGGAPRRVRQINARRQPRTVFLSG